ncbi:MAG: hypothetical protein WC582_04400 [Patescibacteria group bacterium]
MKELFRLSIHLNPLTMWETDTGAVIIAREKAEKNTKPDDKTVSVRIIERTLNGSEKKEIIFVLRHPRAEEDIIITPQEGKKIRSGAAEFAVKKEEFLKLWPDGIANLLFLLSWVEKFLKARYKGYEPVLENWVISLLG